MSSADERIINRLQKIYDAQGAGGASFEELTGEPSDNAALGTALSGKVPTSRTVNGQALSGNVVVTGLMLDTVGAPDNGVGANGDYAFDDATKTIYGPKAGGVWPAGVVLAGSTPDDTAYNATSWNGVTTIAPSKNAVRDILETTIASIVPASDTAYDATTWDGVTTIAPSKNAVRDKIEAVVASVAAIPSSNPLAIYAAGTPYALTATPSDLDFGTTDPVLVINQAGTYLIFSRAAVSLPFGLGAFGVITLGLRRTNNSPINLANSESVLPWDESATGGGSSLVVTLPCVIYTTAGTTDSIAIFGSDTSGSSTSVAEASIIAVRLY